MFVYAYVYVDQSSRNRFNFNYFKIFFFMCLYVNSISKDVNL